MKFHLFLLTTFLVLSRSKSSPAATLRCENPNSRCGRFKGSCTESVVIALTTSDLNAAEDSLFYGKYCGGLNRFQPSEEVGNHIVAPPPCGDGGIDAGCETHDSCLDQKVEEFGGPSVIPIEDRCECNVQLVLDMATALASSGGTRTNLCDAAFYEQVPELGGVAPINLVGHEANLISAPFCCFILGRCSSETSGSSNEIYEPAANYCAQVVSGLLQNGVDLCPPTDF